jgi:hypothetical protein
MNYSSMYFPFELDLIVSKLCEVRYFQVINDRIRITEEGIEALLLSNVINGAPFSSVLNQFSAISREAFSLLTKDITGFFFSQIELIQDISDIMICSPWIRLSESNKRVLKNKLDSNPKLRCVAITRKPINTEAPTYQKWNDQVYSSVKWLIDNGVEVTTNYRLHSKLLIIEGINSSAILCSENLTGASNIELGINIKDDVLVRNLIAYWEELYSSSTILDRDDVDE